MEPEAGGEIFLPPTVASAGQEDSDSGGLLPFTGAALIVPSVLGGLLLAGGLFLVYRTRRREEV
ncbi:MAG: LPXTG cell wall anchor domain-containing protein [Actinomycetota bacterium]|nr:LPXTG cell wall anchor domain-containing protein [Actinomycetota bacterium]